MPFFYCVDFLLVQIRNGKLLNVEMCSYSFLQLGIYVTKKTNDTNTVQHRTTNVESYCNLLNGIKLVFIFVQQHCIHLDLKFMTVYLLVQI